MATFMSSVSSLLLSWYDRHARALPWRMPPAESKQGKFKEPYHVWLSEVMLQQTTVAAAKAYFEKFLTLWPTLSDLAAASQDDVMKAWAGLGYYSRARNLKACADMVVAEYGGSFPTTKSELLKLPGIGDYTASAIAAIAFGERTAVVDGNIERVVTRLTADATALPAAKENCRTFMDQETPSNRPGDFAQAMMDLGATICTPKSPACVLCPLTGLCAARKAGTQTEFPVKAPKKAKPTRKGAAYVVVSKDQSVWVRRRKSSGLLGGMTEVPTTQWTSRKDGDTGADAFPVATQSEMDWTKHTSITHTFTHFHLELEVWSARADELEGDGWWCSASDLPHEAFPSLMRKVIESALPRALLPARS
ncbi:MAG: A/G-specific adenine glycosylase [Pseudomonadota bacterium]